MGSLAILAIVLGSGIVYLTMIGITHRVYRRRRWADEDSWMGGIFWPVMLPVELVRGFPRWVSETIERQLRRRAEAKLPKAKVVTE